jgi:hypothetical protein
MIAIFAAITMTVGTLATTSEAAISPPGFGCGSGWYTQDVCKYDQSKITLAGSTYTLSWQGATATGPSPCDSTNNVNYWGSDGGEWYDNGVNNVHYLPAAHNWTNCAIPGYAIYGSTRAKVAGHTYKMDFYFRYQAGVQTVYHTSSIINGHWNMS